ncbi:MAG: hypothetical protein V3T28_12325 [Gemmatimonadales bacterium]
MSVGRVLAVVAVAGAAWSAIPFSLWWLDTDSSVVTGAWSTWAWGTVVVLGMTGVLVILSKGRVTVWLVDAWRRTLGRLSGRTTMILAGAAVVMFATLVFLLVFAGNPRSVDGFAQLFHARMLLDGRLWLEPPPELANFSTLHMVLGPERWYSQYPPGQPVLLAVGLLLGQWWIVQPLLGILLVVATYHVARWMADETTARLTAWLMAVCPFIVAMTASELNHLPAAVLGMGAAAAATMLDRHRWPGWALAAGASLGLMVAFRPLDAVAAALPVTAVMLLTARQRMGALALIGVGGVAGTLPTLWFNAQTTGSWSQFGYSHLWGSGIALGFHDTPWGVPLTPLRAVALTGLDLHQVNMYLFDLPVPVLVVIAGGFVMGWRQTSRRDLTSFVGVLALTGLLFFYFHRDVFYGPRLLFSIVPWFVLLLARALVLMRRWGPPMASGTPRGMVAVTAVVLALGTGLVAIAPSRLAAYRASTPMLSLHPARDAERAGIHDAVVLIPDGWGTRLIARMWELGVPVRRTGRLYARIDACTLHRTLDAAERDGMRDAQLVTLLDTLAALGRPGAPLGLTEDRNLRIPTWEPLRSECIDEIAFDRAGFLAFAPFLYLNNASLDGDIVWARDMRSGNAVLAARYPGRRFYRYEVGPGGRSRFTRMELRDGTSTPR